MDNVIRTDINLLKTAVDQFGEEKVEYDIIIPEYCAPIGKILKCDASPVITSKTVNDDKLLLHGQCEISVIYCDDESGTIKSISENVPFEKSFRIENQLNNYRLISKVRVNNIVGRYVNSKKVNVKLILGIAVKMMGNDSISVVSDIGDCDIETMNDSVELCMYSNYAEGEVRISGEISTAHNITDVIKTYQSVTLKDIKPIKDKVIVKGELLTNVLYTYGEGISDFDIVEGKIPFTEVVEVDESDESSEIYIEPIVKSLKCFLEEDRLIVESEVLLCTCVYNNTVYSTVTDLFSKKNTLNVSSKDIFVEFLSEKSEFNENITHTIDFEFNDARIVNINEQPTVKNISYTDGCMLIEGEISVTIYAYNENEYRIIDKNVPFSIEKDLKITSESIRCEANVESKDISFVFVNDNKIEINTELLFSLNMYCKRIFRIIDNFTVETNENDDTISSKVIIYFAQKGEALWDIAKKFKTSVDTLKNDNDLEGYNILNDRVILVSK